MKVREILRKPVQLFTGKYGILLLTLLNAALACLVITITNRWVCLDPARGSGDFMTFYLLDYRVGFISRAFIGSILYLFTKHPTVRMVSFVLYTVIILSVLLFCFFQAQVAKKTILRREHATLLLSYLFFLNSFFWCDAFEFFGLPDIFITLLLQLYLLCTERNRTLGFFLAPLVCTVGLLIHTSFLFVGFVVVAAILWFDLLQRGKPGGVHITLFVTACIASVVLFVLFVFFTQEMVRVNMYEMLDLVHQKYDGRINEEYYTAYLFQTSEAHPELTEKHFLQFLLEYNRADHGSSKVRKYLLDILPLTAAFFAGCVFHARQSGTRKIAYLGCLAPFAALFPALSVSTDKERFFSLCLIAQYMLLHYIIMRTDDRFLPGTVTLPQTIHAPSNPLKSRSERANLVLSVCTIAGAVFTLIGYETL